MANAFNNTGLFLINTLFDLYLFVLVIRLILAFNRANYFNPITQFFIKLTQPIVAPVRRVVPNYRGIEWSTVIWIILLEMIKFFLIGLIAFGFPNLLGLIVLAFADTIKLILNTFLYAILIQALLSWIQPGYTPAAQLLDQITSPIMRPLERHIPPVAGFNITPIPALIIIEVIILLLVNPFIAFGMNMAFSS